MFEYINLLPVFVLLFSLMMVYVNTQTFQDFQDYWDLCFYECLEVNGYIPDACASICGPC